MSTSVQELTTEIKDQQAAFAEYRKRAVLARADLEDELARIREQLRQARADQRTTDQNSYNSVITLEQEVASLQGELALARLRLEAERTRKSFWYGVRNWFSKKGPSNG